MPEENRQSRLRCEQCLRPESHCLCAYIPRIENRTRVVVLQHPDEAKHPLNTARLAVLGLCRAELRVGTVFPDLADMIGAVDVARLLFPTRDGEPEAPLSPLPSDASALLIVPDGTWRKARQLVRLNPALQSLPRVSLPAGDASAYRVRKATEVAAVATIEAIERALSVLEHGRDFSPLLAPFHAMVQGQIDAMGEEVYRRNHAPGSSNISG